MPRLNLRQFKRDISYVSDTLVFTPPVAVPSLAVGGVDVTASLQSNAAAVSAEKTRLDTLLDVGTSLDQITELRAAWESGDGTLTSAIAGLTSTAQTDRALIRTEFASADTALQSQITTNATDVDALEATVNVTHVALHTQHTAQIAATTTAYIAADVVVSNAYVAADTVVTNAFTSADNTIRSRLDVAELKSSYTDPTTQTLLSAETGARASGDNTLSGRLDIAEAKSSFTDPTTQTLLSAEATTRAATDNSLSGRMDVAEAKSSYTDPTTQTLLSSEATTRASAVSTLSGRLDIAEAKSSYADPTTQTLLGAESTTRASADNSLSGRLDAAEAKSSYTDPTTQTLLVAESTTRASADNSLSGRLDVAEAKSSYTDPTTQALLTTEASSRESADTTLSGRLDVAEAKSSFTDPTTQTLLNVEKGRIDSNVSAISLNTAKTGITTEQAGDIDANNDKVVITAGQASAIVANTAKYSTSATDTLLDAKQEDLTNTSHTHLHLHSGGHFVGLGTIPSYHLHIKDSGDPTVKIERASNNFVVINETHFMIVKPVNAQFDFNLQGYSNDMVFKTNNTERLRLKANGGIIMPNLPTSDPVVAGQLWVERRQ